MDNVARILLSTDDAMVWAEQFCRTFQGRTVSEEEEGINVGTMVGWFANAMYVAVRETDERRKGQERVPAPDDGDVQ